ncbi:Hpt domain-containing protein [Shewanella phaeophyticola]|uniref:Hpt domain-containing protein n=1 Tax=Shewanella phaeophyticola TaxID=2978345 RepID=A0ABT2P1K5_9GAMM|nr:Hpt domain-containing protein [Shewanella sp. KJ10-1]MCT8985789.1 Hpt domain-containing protein [Shewanella sp. KJ10-1]
MFEEHRDLEHVNPDAFSFEQREKRLALAAEIHKLRGSSGMVGAKELYNLTSQAEISLRKGEHDEQAQLLRNIIRVLKELRRNSQQFLELQSQVRSQTNESVEPLADKMTQSEVEKLILALETNDLSASETVENNAASIMALMGQEAFSTFNEQVQMLNYPKALEILEKSIMTDKQ